MALLLHVLSPTCHEDLKIYDKVLFKTFYEAAQARNLVLSGETFLETFKDHSGMHNPKELRNLLAQMLLTKTIANGEKYWADFQEEMIGDFLNDPDFKNFTTEQLLDLALHDLNRQFSSSGMTNRAYGIPMPKDKKTLPKSMQAPHLSL